MRKSKDGFGQAENKSSFQAPLLTVVDRIVIAIKLLGIFLLVRLVMLDSGNSFFYIPFVDHELVKFVSYLKSWLGFVESFWRQYR